MTTPIAPESAYLNYCRRSRVMYVFPLQSRERLEREPSRIPYMRIIKLFRETKLIRDAAKSYLKKCIPNSLKLKFMQFEYNRLHFMESRCGRRKVVFSKNYLTQKVHACLLRLRTSKHKNSPLFCMFALNQFDRKKNGFVTSLENGQHLGDFYFVGHNAMHNR